MHVKQENSYLYFKSLKNFTRKLVLFTCHYNSKLKGDSRVYKIITYSKWYGLTFPGLLGHCKK